MLHVLDFAEARHNKRKEGQIVCVQILILKKSYQISKVKLWKIASPVFFHFHCSCDRRHARLTFYHFFNSTFLVGFFFFLVRDSNFCTEWYLYINQPQILKVCFSDQILSFCHTVNFVLV